MHYKNSKIYTIRCHKDASLIYVGSTTQLLSKRLGDHKSKAKSVPDRLFYSKIEDWNDWYIELFEEYPCENKEQLLKREGEVIRKIGTLNHTIAGRTHKEYCADNKEKLKLQMRCNYEKNADLRKKNNREFRQNNLELMKERERHYYHQNREKKVKSMKKYREENREKLKEARKDFYNQNKEKIIDKQTHYYNQNRDKIRERQRLYYQQKKENNIIISVDKDLT